MSGASNRQTRGAAGGQGSLGRGGEAAGCLVSLLRLGLLAITFSGTVNVALGLVHASTISRTTHAPLASTYLALVLAEACTILMVALSVNATFLTGRLFSVRVAGYLFVAVFVLGAGSIGVGLLGSTQLGAYMAAAYLLLPAGSFVVTMLMARGLFARFPPPPPRRSSSSGASRPPARRATHRQRRGGRKR